jgi:hypothetical protein
LDRVGLSRGAPRHFTAVAFLLAACSRPAPASERAPAPAKPVEAARAPDAGPAPRDALHEGDIAFQTSRSAQSKAIQLATHSRFSHVGIVRLESGTPFVYEAVGPVKATPFDAWVARGEGRRVVVMRLKDADRRLTPDAIAALRRSEDRFRGRPYDQAFGWSDERIYCSELVWKVYDEALGEKLADLQRLGDFDLTNPVVTAKVRERYGDRVPLDEPVISPGALADSPRLEIVLDQG